MNRNILGRIFVTIKDLITKTRIQFSSDFIVGYPGEESFNDTISLVKEIKFINSFSFIYNQRPGTPASKHKSVNNKLQHDRLSTLQSHLKKFN